jgi:hypothetical protein
MDGRVLLIRLARTAEVPKLSVTSTVIQQAIDVPMLQLCTRMPCLITSNRCYYTRLAALPLLPLPDCSSCSVMVVATWPADALFLSRVTADLKMYSNEYHSVPPDNRRLDGR